MTDDRRARWIPLLRTLTADFPTWAVWKNARSALEGHGDIDSFAPDHTWPDIENVWLSWLQDYDFSTAIVCRHVPQGPHFVAIDGTSPWIWQLDVKRAATFRGATMIDVPKLQALVEIDAEEYRRIRAGAEGVLKLLYNGMQPFGRQDREGLEIKRVVPLLESDLEGARLASQLLCGPTASAMNRAVDALLDGGWDRRSLVQVESWFRGKALVEPARASSRVWFNAVSKKACPVLEVIRKHDRELPEDTDEWLRRVAENHRVIDISPRSA